VPNAWVNLASCAAKHAKLHISLVNAPHHSYIQACSMAPSRFSTWRVPSSVANMSMASHRRGFCFLLSHDLAPTSSRHFSSKNNNASKGVGLCRWRQPKAAVFDLSFREASSRSPRRGGRSLFEVCRRHPEHVSLHDVKPSITAVWNPIATSQLGTHFTPLMSLPLNRVLTRK